MLPSVVIVGRPNVGKSSLFNRIIGRNAAVVSNREGVTRDRHFQEVHWNHRAFMLIDTGGFLVDPSIDPLADEVTSQIQVAVEESQLVLFVVDARVPPTKVDLKLSRMLNKSGRTVLLVCNKMEKPEDQLGAYEYLQMGMGEGAMVSALQGAGVPQLLNEILSHLPDAPERPEEQQFDCRIAILGRPNAGKSTLLNTMLGEQRVITSDIPGTTRDAIDCSMEINGKHYLITDTAGLRKKAKVKEDVEYYSNMRALEAVRRAEVCWLMVDATRATLEIQDYRIVDQIKSLGRGLMVLLNKWDLVEKDHKTFDHFVKEVRYKVPALENVPFISISALSGQRVHRLLEKTLEVRANCFRVLGRDALVEVFRKACMDNPHPIRKTHKIQMTRACQILVNPPVVAVEVNYPELVDEQWKRYFMKALWEAFPLEGAPLKLNFDKEIKLRKDEELGAYA